MNALSRLLLSFAVGFVCASASAQAPCSSGSPTTIWLDDLENPSSGNWSTTTVSGNNHWDTGSGLYSTQSPSSGTYSFWGRGLASSGQSFVRMTAPVTVTSGMRLQFAHSFDFEQSFDGGFVEYSTNGGTTWTDAGSLFAAGTTYTGTVFLSPGSRQGFTGNSSGYTATQLDLATLAGQNVLFRFFVKTDFSGGDTGWFVDDVHFYTCPPPPPGITVAPTAVVVSESGTNANVSVTLQSQPSGDVVIDVASTDSGEATVSPSQLTFTPANWSTAKTITITGADDLLDDDEQISLVTLTMNAAATADPLYDPIDPADVTVTTTDDEAPGVKVTPASVSMFESGGTSTFQVKLGLEPAGNVVIDLASLDTGEVTVSPSQLTFTPANWSSNQTVTVTGVDDDLDDGTQTTTVALTINAAATDDPAYDAVDAPDVTVSTFDDDFSIAIVSRSSVTVTENGLAATFTVRLDAEPTGNVVIDVAATDTSEATVAPQQVTFTPANWATPQTITVTGVDDPDSDGNQVSTIALTMNTAATQDPKYDLHNPPDVTATTIDNESAAVHLSPASVSVSESGTASIVTVLVSKEPSGNVVIDFASLDTSEATVSPAQLTFTPANWASPQTVTVTGVNDFLDDDAQNTFVVVSMNTAATDDPAYDALNPTDISVTIADNDTTSTGVTMPPSIAVTEAGSTATFTVFIGCEPTGDVVIDVVSGDTSEITAAPAQLTFTPANWATAQTVTLTGVNDTADDGDQVTTIVLTINTALTQDPKYDLQNPPDVTATTIDDDPQAAVVVSPLAVTVAEAGGSATFSVVLGAQPASNVVVDVASLDTGEATVSPSQLTFTPANWSTAQTVTVTGVDDGIDDGDQTTSVTITGGSSVTVTTTDDDTASINVSPLAVTVSEAGSSATFTVVLGAQPLSNVVVDVASLDTGEAAVSPSQLTFTPANWSTAQTVTVTGVDDVIDDGDQITTITVSDGSSVTVTTTDDDTASVNVSPLAVTVSEAGSSATFTVVLGAQPLSNVVVDVASLDTGEATAAPSQLTFTPANWSSAQTVTVTGVDDVIDDGDQTTSVTVSGGSSVTVTTTDDDTASVNVSPLAVTVSEAGSSATFTVVLGAQPLSNVVVDVASLDTGEAVVSPSQLTFTPANWSTAQTVTVTGVDDVIDDGDQTTSVTITGGSSVTVTTTDDDTASINVSPLAVTVSETGTTATFTVVLGAEPVSDVVIGVASTDTGEATVAPSQLTFTPANWNSAQTVTVTGVDDLIDDGDQTTTVTITGGQNVTVTTTDDDTASVNVSPLAVTVSETGTTATFTVVLGAQPVSDLVIDVASTDTGEATVAPSQLTFTPANWSTAQTVTVTGVDDVTDDGDQTTAVTITGGQNVSVTTTDDDNSGVSVSPTAMTVFEGGATATFSVMLISQPTSDVVISIASTDTGEVTVSPAQVTFTPNDWSPGRTVTVTAVDDAIDDGDRTTTITVTGDAAYPAPDPHDVAVTAIDNDTASVQVSPLAVTVSESGTNATFTVVLGAPPVGNVVIDVASTDTGEATVAPSQLTFTPANWSAAQTVTVTGVDDAIDDGDQTTLVTVTNGPNVTVTTADDDKTPTTTALASSANPSVAGQSVTFTATVTPSTITGSVTFRDGATVLDTVPLAAGSAAFSTSALAAGTHAITAQYAGDANFDGSTSPTLSQVVNPPFGAPSSLTAGATSATEIAVSWSAVAGATAYEIHRTTSIAAAYSIVTTTAATAFTDTGRTANTTYLYKIRALGSSGPSPFSAVDAATTTVFTDPVLTSGTAVKPVHVMELRTAVNAMRAAGRLAGAAFTDPTITGSTMIRAAHLTELRAALDAARAAIGLTALSYTDPAITPGVTRVKAVHWMELRAGTQ